MPDSVSEFPWQRPLGAHPQSDGLTELRVWAPRAERVAVRVRGVEHALRPEGRGVYAARMEAAHGDRYEVVLDGTAWPDPASRHQPEGLRGPSAVVDPRTLKWTDAGWGGVALSDLVIYELHVGTFTEEGTFDAAIGELARLRAVGITAIELMPVADFPGMRGWGYDGVYLSAAHRAYGGPEALARLVDAAHAAGLAVLLDVVYNHVGASGQQALEAFGPYFTDRYSTFWGDAINYDDADCDPVREWVIQSAEGWVRDFHVDGLRLDAIHAIYDFSARHVLAELAARVRPALVIAESGLNDPKVIRPDGLGLDGNWADDLHHALHALLTGERDGYYEDFGSVAQLAKAFRRPFVHDGTWSEHRRQFFGAPAFDRPPEQFVVFAQNHDQVGNRAFGDRLPTDARPLAALCTLLSPFTPLLFMGEEYGESAPFQFFTDHIDHDITEATREGRRREFAAFASFEHDVPDPQDPATFTASKLTRQEDPAMRDLYAALLRARRELRGEAEATFDEDAKWLVVRRGEHAIACNFADEPREVPVAASEVVVAAGDAELRGPAVALGAKSGALLR
jgi:maltooligosyltrehalose trehalohydrolase